MFDLKLRKKDVMIIVCGNNRLRLYKYELPTNFYHYKKPAKELECKRLIAHQKRCGQVIKAFVGASV